MAGKVSTRGAIQIRPAISEIRLRIFAVMARPSSMSAIAQSVNSPWNLNNSERKFCEFLPHRGMILIKLRSICWLIPRRFWDFSLVFVDLGFGENGGWLWGGGIVVVTILKWSLMVEWNYNCTNSIRIREVLIMLSWFFY